MPLRPELYRRLVQEFGNVIIADAGVPMRSVTYQRAIDDRPQMSIACSGEYYRVDCPFCPDTRQRLWINHRWGLRDPDTGSDNLWLCHCFKRECLRSWGRQRVLYEMLFDPCTPYDPNKDFLLKAKVPTPESAFVPAELPGEVLRLDQLPQDHIACKYLRQRGYDPSLLGIKLNVGYCVSNLPRYLPARDRIIIPIYMRGELVGWQGRLPRETGKHEAKYYTMPGMRKSAILYNFDNASKSRFVVVCEGPTDVWSFGPEAVAILGKSLSTIQRQLVSSSWSTAIILLDGDAVDEIQGICDVLRGGRQTVIPVFLPDGKDPGDFHTQFLRDTVRAAAAKVGVNLAL